MALAGIGALLLAGACASTREGSSKARAPTPSADDEELRAIAREHAHQIAGAVQLYWFVNEDYPSEDEGLRALLDPPKGKPIFRVLPQDPWGREFVYRRPGAHGHAFDVYSRGPDGEAGTSDDVGTWEVRASKPRPAPHPLPKRAPVKRDATVLEL